MYLSEKLRGLSLNPKKESDQDLESLVIKVQAIIEQAARNGFRFAPVMLLDRTAGIHNIDGYEFNPEHIAKALRSWGLDQGLLPTVNYIQGRSYLIFHW